MEVSIPDVVVQKENATSSVYEDDHVFEKDSSLSQLGVDLEAPNRNKSPVTVQEWVDSLPLMADYNCREECDTSVSAEPNSSTDIETDMFTLGTEAGHLRAHKSPICSSVNVTITNCHEPSEVDSHCSSVDSLLEARKPDPEEILLSLGFGGTASSSYLETGRVPKRFLSPSQLKGVDIEEFIRQQQDLIYTFESGFYGYRGLAGPSHSNPSVIVAKILEKLREHEKETALVNSCHQDCKKGYSADQDTVEVQPRRFSKVARNVLTKIRCTPGSVLSPDNRRWLDNQGNKSPEVARRLILGQQSFTFGRDGDLIESFDGCKSNSHGNLDTNFECDFQNVGNEVGPDQRQLPFGKISTKIRKTDDSNDQEFGECWRSPTENVNVSGTDWSSLCRVVVPSTNAAAPGEARDDDTKRKKKKTKKKSTCSDKSTSSSESNDDNSGSFASSRIPLTYATTAGRNRLGGDRVDDTIEISVGRGGDGGATNETLSLQDEIDESTRTNRRFDVTENSTSGGRRHSSNRNYLSEKRDRDSDDESSANVIFRLNENHGSQILNEFSDSATESELATYSPRTFLNKNIFKQYEEYALLKSKIKPSDKLPDSITSEQFLSFTTEQRTSLQSRVIREALEMYLDMLKEDNINIELKNCLCNEVRKVFDLVDGSSDSSRLAVIVRQMTLLLQQQNRLSAEIKELSVADLKTPSTCNQMCDQLLKRVQDLELLVQQNAQELARMKNQLPSQK